MTSIKDVARMAGVSYTTVSHVINHTRPVNKDTALKVENAIKELNYVPSATAIGLRKGRTKTIGVVDANIFDLFFSEVMKSAQNTLEAAGYSLYFSYCHQEETTCNEKCLDFYAEKELSYLDKLIARSVDAIIINPINKDDVLTGYLNKVTTPFILFQRDLAGSTTFPIMSDDFDGGYKAVNYLISLGHTNIAVIYGFSYPTHSVSQRRNGVKKALQNAGLAQENIIWRYGNYNLEYAYNQSVDLLKGSNRPTAIFYYSDTMAMGGFRAASDLGIKVPEELSIIGYDDIHLARFTIPRLSTIRQDSFHMGRYLGQKTLDCIEAGIPEALSKESLPVELVVRESTGPCPNKSTPTQ